MSSTTSSAPALAFALLIMGTTLGIAGTDLVLPAVPGLPEVLGGTSTMAQYVLAAFVGGTCAGLILFGELGARLDQRVLLIASLGSYAILSLACTAAPNLETLIGLRFFQGLSGSAAAVIGPGMIRAMFREERAIRALGLMGSIESLVPALAPVLGVWLLDAFGWASSFHLLGALSLAAAVTAFLQWKVLPEPDPTRGAGSYFSLIINSVFQRYALSQAMTLGGLLIFVFGAPAMITKGLGGELSDFIIMQVTGIALFIIGANVAGKLADIFGAETMILTGSFLSAAGLLALLLYGLMDGRSTIMLAVFFAPVNLGLGFRGPPGFFRAILASGSDDARGAALVILSIFLVTAIGTVIAAPFVTDGLVPLAAVAAATSCLSVASLLALPKLPVPGQQDG